MMTVQDYLRPQQWMREEGGPFYAQLRRRLEGAIAEGLLGPDMAIPPSAVAAGLRAW